jgi:uncharacterized protein DUF6551
MSNPLDKRFNTEVLPVRDLEIDRKVQREIYSDRKVENIMKNFNPAALGVITVSRRNQVTQVIVDGWHRWSAVKILTDNNGEMLCNVFEDLTLEEEAQLFLDLNDGSQPNVMDRFRARLIVGDPVAADMDKLTKYYGWVIQRQGGNGTLQCVQAIERVYRKSAAAGDEPNVLQEVVMVLNRAWGNDKHAGSAVIIEALAAFISEYSTKIDFDRLYRRLSEYPGGPSALLNDSQTIAAARRMRIPMAVADQITDNYNRNVSGPGLKAKALPTWRRSR